MHLAWFLLKAVLVKTPSHTSEEGSEAESHAIGNESTVRKCLTLSNKINILAAVISEHVLTRTEHAKSLSKIGIVRMPCVLQ